MKLKNKNVLVYGLARSGLASIELLKKQKATIFLYDDDKLVLKAIQNKKEITECATILFELETDSLDFFDVIVLSPSVSIYTELIKQAQLKGVSVISELELGFLHKNGRMIAVTGTNGKTTTVELITHILKEAGKPVVSCGNIGVPLSESVLVNKKHTIYVAEVSSFQLESIHKFAPDYACLINITPDHLDRHFTLKNYINAKLELFKNSKKKKVAIFNIDDENIKKTKIDLNCEVYFYSTKKEVIEGVFLKQGIVYFKNNGIIKQLLKKEDIPLLGLHNLSNALCAILVTYLYGISVDFIKTALKSFKLAPHRLEFVKEHNGVWYYNDSKATNLDACLKAVESFTKNIILMLGGSDKGENYNLLFKNLPKNVRHIVVSGTNAKKILTSAKKYSFLNITRAKNFEDCFYKAQKEVKEGEVLLLSPASASFDEFNNYKERGETFKELVNGL